jgi:hypothetical protein
MNPIVLIVIASDPLLITVRTKVSVCGGEGCSSVGGRSFSPTLGCTSNAKLTLTF